MSTRTTLSLKLFFACILIATSLSFCEDKQPHITTIFSDIEGVLITTNPVAYLSELGIGKLARYTLVDWQNPKNLIKKAHALIKKMGDDGGVLASYPNGEQPTHGPSPMAKDIALWQSDSKNHSSQWILSKALETIDAMDKEGKFANKREKQLMQKVAHSIFLPDGARTKRTIKPIVKLIQQMHNQKDAQGKHKYRLVIISNIATDGYWQALKKKFSALFGLFDGYVLSGDIGLIKPDQKIYEYALKQYNVKPEESVFLDDKLENIRAAEKAGIRGIQVNKSDGYASVGAELKNLGVLTL